MKYLKSLLLRRFIKFLRIGCYLLQKNIAIQVFLANLPVSPDNPAE